MWEDALDSFESAFVINEINLTTRTDQVHQ